MAFTPYINDFVTYEATTPSKVELTLPLENDPIDISDWSVGISPSGIPIVKNTLPTAFRSTPLNNSTTETSSTEDLSSLSFEDLVKQENLPIKITSGFRGKGDFRGGKTLQGKRSNHNRLDSQGKPMAYDIVPINGNFEELLNLMYSNPRIVSWFKQRGYGILEETTPSVMKRTGATGKHLHIGPDTSARKMFNYRISKAQQGMKISPFIEYESAEIPESNLELPPINSPLTDPPNNIIGFNSNGVPIVRSSMPTATRSQNTDFIPQITTNMENNKNSISNKVKGNQKELLSQTIDKLSKEDPNIGKIKQFLMDTAALESSYKMNSTSKASSASGWFGFLDSSKKMASKALGINFNREQFNNDPELQVKSAAWLYYNHLNTATKQGTIEAAKNKGYSVDDVIHSYWLNPTWAKNFFLRGIKGGKDAFGTDIEKYLKKIHS